MQNAAGNRETAENKQRTGDVQMLEVCISANKACETHSPCQLSDAFSKFF